MTEIEQLNLQNPPPPESPADRTYVHELLRPRLMTQVHTSPSSGHPGINATANLLSNITNSYRIAQHATPPNLPGNSQPVC